MLNKKKSSNKLAKTKGKSKAKRNLIKFLKVFTIIFIVLAIIATVTGTIIAAQVIKNVSKMDANTLFLEEQSVLYDKNGELIATIGPQRKNLEYEEIPEVFIEALLAIEDARFFGHDGIDRPRLSKAALTLGKNGGGSTLTMQVSKNRYTKLNSIEETTKEKVERKIEDLYVSTRVIEKNYTKEEILAFYSNILYLGNYSYGLAAASNNYFQKQPEELNLAEASFLAGLFKAPNVYDVTVYGTAPAEARRNTVLDLMVRHGYISQEQADATKAIPLASYLNTTTNFNTTKVEYTDYVNAAINEVKEKTGLNPYKDSMQIYTNMDPQLQEHLYSIKLKDYYYSDKVLVASTVIDNTDGSVAGILSGRETSEVGLNYATALQQPGSTAKPTLDYAPCFEQGNCVSINETIADEKYSYSNGTSIKNFDGKFMGTITLKTALSQSRNIPALKVFQRNNQQATIEMAKSMGLQLGIDPANGDFYESHAIGGYTGESTMTNAGAYSSFARGGLFTSPHTVSKVNVNYSRPDAEEIDLTPETSRVMKTTTADAINQMLIASSSPYFNEIKGKGINFAIKTGTSNWDPDFMAKVGLSNSGTHDNRDNWAIAYSTDYTTALWYGYDKLDKEYVKNGWYMKSYSEVSIKYAVGRDIVLGEHQPREWKEFPNWGTANAAAIEKEVAKDDQDDDNDGIKNKDDKCDKTPAGDKVDATGCTVKEPVKPVDKDSDKDGVLDSVDQCPSTPIGATVDEVGCEEDETTDPDTRSITLLLSNYLAIMNFDIVNIKLF